HRLTGEAVEALDDVADDPRPPRFAVGDEVDARLGLLACDFGHGVADRLGVGVAVVILSAFLRAKEGNERVGPRQAADVRRQDPFGASLHTVWKTGRGVASGASSVRQSVSR